MTGVQTCAPPIFARKADVNAAEADGSTALLWAAYHNNAEIARLRGVLRDMQALLHDRYADESVLLGSCMVITDKALGGEDV